MRANSSEGKYSRRKFQLPATHNLDETRQQWKQKNAEARVADAQMRIFEKKQVHADEDDDND
jgi:hypothetical protein